MKERDRVEEALRRMVRSQLSSEQPKRRTAGRSAVIIAAMVVPIVLFAAAAVNIYIVWRSDGFKEIADFVRWLFNCMSAHCP